MHRLTVAVAACLAVLAGPARAQQPAAPPPPERHVRGVVASLEGDKLVLKLPGGKRATLTLAADTRVSVASKADLASIGQGLFVGTTAVAQPDGTLRAVEVHLFPEAMRGAGEGHRPWDLKPGSTMTNATVSAAAPAAVAAPPSTMTNATVAAASKAGAGLKLTLTYPSGEQTVLVPPGVPVVKLEPADRTRVVAGAHVFAAGPLGADGTVQVKRMVVGQGGLRPPM